MNKNTVSYWAKLQGFNGRSLNGVNLNGNTWLRNGVNFNGVNLNGVNLNGVNLNGVNLNGSELRGEDPITSAIKAGTDLENSVVEGVFSDESTIPLFIKHVTVDTDPSAPVLYEIWIADYDQENQPYGAQPVCVDDNENPVPAVLLQGHWNDGNGDKTTGDEDVLTLACVNAALGKCVVWGYHPWETKIIYPGTPPSPALTNCTGANTGLCTELSMASVHQACTRMVRADYCGNGTPHTQNGTPINIWDPLDIQVHGDPGSSFLAEAEWTPSGARCIRRTRKTSAGNYNNSLTDWQNVNNICPERVAGTIESRNDHACDEMGQCGGLTEACLGTGAATYCDCNVVACDAGWTCNTGTGHCEEACDGGSSYLFSSSSTFVNSVGYSVPLTNSNPRLERKMLRNESE